MIVELLFGIVLGYFVVVPLLAWAIYGFLWLMEWSPMTPRKTDYVFRLPESLSSAASGM